MTGLPKRLRHSIVIGAISGTVFFGAAHGQDIGILLGLTGPNGVSLGQWNLDGDRVAPADLYLQPDVATNGVLVPHRGPYVFTRQTPETGAHAVFALVFSDAPVACAEEVGTFPLDTSLAAFMTATDAEALYAYGNSIAETGQDPAQLTSDPLGPNHVSFVTLPNGAIFPAAAVQYEGDSPLYGFYDDAGDLVALAGMFGIEERNGPDVPPCATPTS